MQMEEVKYVVEPATELLEMGEFGQQHWWSRQWVPFLRDYDGSFLCLDMAGAFGGQPGQLITYAEDDPRRTIEYPDLAAFLSALVSAFDSGGPGAASSDATPAFPAGYPIEHRAA